MPKESSSPPPDLTAPDSSWIQQALDKPVERLELALAAGRLGDWNWDALTDAVNLSRRAAEIFGLTPQTPITWSKMRDMLHEEDRELARVAVERSLAEHSDYDIEYRVTRPNGESCWIGAKGRGVYSPQGVVGMIGVVQDVTDRKRVEESLRDESRMLDLLNKTGARIASGLDLQTIVQTVTDAATELSGAKFGAFFYNVINQQGESFLLYSLSGAPREMFDKFGLPRNTAVFNPTFRGEGIVRSDDITQDFRYGRQAPHHGMPKGHLPVCSYLAVPVISRSGEVLGGLFFGHPDRGVFTERSERLMAGIAAQAAIAIDNSRLYEVSQRAADERKLLLESERFARSEAERMSDMKDKFLSTLSHELRTPLSAILGWVQVLQRRAIEHAELRGALDTIERNARLQTQLIDDLLDMSRITSGKMRLDIQRVDPSAFIDAAIETLRPAADAKEIRVHTMLDPSAGPISGDPARLQQVMWNLLSNAYKFTSKGGKVEILLQRVNSHIEISVADTGIGISQELLSSIFDRFRQADSSTTRRYGGLGLGLSIVKSLIEQHGGTVRAFSRGVDQGTTVVVHLPVTVVHRADKGEERVHPRAMPEISADWQVADLSGIQVLFVDDEPDARELVQVVLGDCGAEVTTAASANDALQLLRRRRFDLVVTDIGMADVDGYELLRRIQAFGADEGWKIPVVALTAFARSEDRTRALQAGFVFHLSKPVDPAELVATVANVARRTPGG